MDREERKVLVVDDEPAIRSALELVMEDVGFVPIVAENGHAAIAALGEHRFGVAIVDKNLPGDHSGLDLLTQIRRDHPFTKVILHTGFPSTQ